MKNCQLGESTFPDEWCICADLRYLGVQGSVLDLRYLRISGSPTPKGRFKYSVMTQRVEAIEIDESTLLTCRIPTKPLRPWKLAKDCLSD
jgi:hypothetical protein